MNEETFTYIEDENTSTDSEEKIVSLPNWDLLPPFEQVDRSDIS